VFVLFEYVYDTRFTGRSRAEFVRSARPQRSFHRRNRCRVFVSFIDFAVDEATAKSYAIIAAGNDLAGHVFVEQFSRRGGGTKEPTFLGIPPVRIGRNVRYETDVVRIFVLHGTLLIKRVLRLPRSSNRTLISNI